MEADNGLIYAWRFDGAGGAQRVGWPEVRRWTGGQGVLWVHLDLGAPAAAQWVLDDSGLPRWAGEALLERTTRPRADCFDDGLLAVLRGVNLNPGAEPHDMIALRMWADPHRIITIRSEKLRAVVTMREALERGAGPTSPASLLVWLLRDLAARAAEVVSQLDHRLEGLDEAEDQAREIREIKLRCARLRMHLRPQRDAVDELAAEEELSWLSQDDYAAVRQITHRFARLLDQVESIRDEAAIRDGELRALADERINRRLYLLAIISAIFLPLTFLTGLLGSNVGGIPGEGWPWGFAVVCVLTIVVGVGVLAVLKTKRWL